MCLAVSLTLRTLDATWKRLVGAVVRNMSADAICSSVTCLKRLANLQALVQSADLPMYSLRSYKIRQSNKRTRTDVRISVPCIVDSACAIVWSRLQAITE